VKKTLLAVWQKNIFIPFAAAGIPQKVSSGNWQALKIIC
jgi:hypothetical protein